MYRIEHYLTAERSKDLYVDWLRGLRDIKAKVAVIRRVARIEQGNFGDHKFCRDGVWELRVDIGPGYRVYFGEDPEHIVVLICGGDKSSQSNDINKARIYWKEHKNHASLSYTG